MICYSAICLYCGKDFNDDELYLNHLITSHTAEVRNYMSKVWSGGTYCQGGCRTFFKTEDLTLDTRCYNSKHKNPYPVGKVAFRLAARFVAARNADRLKQ